MAGGMNPAKILRVQGLAASMLYEKNDPESPLNRRISIIVMNREAEDRVFQAAEAESSTTATPSEDEKSEQAASSPLPISR
jgi:chemotaxis protein MotB